MNKYRQIIKALEAEQEWYIKQLRTVQEEYQKIGKTYGEKDTQMIIRKGEEITRAEELEKEIAVIQGKVKAVDRMIDVIFDTITT